MSVNKQEMEDYKVNQELAKEGKAKLRIPIWRCRVCGRGGEPYIVCNVAPYIEPYDEVEA
jgi:rubrerythrin